MPPHIDMPWSPFIGGIHIFFKDCDQYAKFIQDAAEALIKIDPEFKRALLSDDSDPETSMV